MTNEMHQAQELQLRTDLLTGEGGRSLTLPSIAPTVVLVVRAPEGLDALLTSGLGHCQLKHMHSDVNCFISHSIQAQLLMITCKCIKLSLN